MIMIPNETAKIQTHYTKIDLLSTTGIYSTVDSMMIDL